MTKSLKQAVVLIHGVGEQVPMDTLRSFVNTVWTEDCSLPRPGGDNTIWSKPDDMSRDYELRRLTTAANRDGRRTDFFEFYWANLMSDTKLSHVWAWIRVLLLRSPRNIPRQLQGIWWFLVLLAIAIAVAWANHLAGWWIIPGWLAGAFRWGGPVIWFVVSSLLVTHAGDAARYLHIAPANVENRRRIRSAGVGLIKSLHDSGKYDRIILVGHSLGTVIGYDILTHLWPQYNERHELPAGNADSRALDALEACARSGKLLDPSAYQEKQSAYFAELRSRGCPWLVTDFVTMGSPLAHAAALMAKSDQALRNKITEREFPECPPAFEEVDGSSRFSFWRNDGVRVPHHGAVFAPVRWTNLYFPCRWTLLGDVIGGPVAANFGLGIRDVPVETDLQAGVFTHTCYWTLGESGGQNPPEHIIALRAALRICIGTRHPAQLLDTDGRIRARDS